MTIRIVQWTSGGVARQCVRHILARPDMELVGMYAYSADKVGADAGELVGLPALGIKATNDIDQLLALKPDCVSYSPLFPDVAHIERILEAGVNIVTTSLFMTGWNISTKQAWGQQDAVERISAAATKGKTSIFGSGMNPGFINYLAGVVSGLSHNVSHVRVTESVDVCLFAGDGYMDPLGWGLPEGSPGHAERVLEETRVFGDGIEVMARMLGIKLDDIRCAIDFAYATEDLPLEGRPIAKGTVAGMKINWQGYMAGRCVLENCQIWAMGNRIEPPMPVDHAYIVEVNGDPHVRTRLEIMPAGDLAAMGKEDFHATGMTITGLPSINAIPAVCKAEPGIRTYADLPTISGVFSG